MPSWFGRTPVKPSPSTSAANADATSSADVDAADEPVIAHPPGRVDQLLIPATVLESSLVGLALGRDREMLCYWIGVAIAPGPEGQSRALVTTVAFPQIVSGYDFFRLVDGQMGQLTEWCSARGLWILAQVHTHPTDEPHSEADECGPVSHRPGFLSVVIPFFAQLSTLREPQWRVHELRGAAQWTEVDPARRLEVVSHVWLPGH